MTLSEKQQRFALLICSLIQWADKIGYKVTLGEAYRTPEQAALNAQKGTGISNSLHTIRLAIDLNLFKNGVYLTNSEDYQMLGEYWKSLDPDCAWGGDFKQFKAADGSWKGGPDGNHFSLAHQGIK